MIITIIIRVRRRRLKERRGGAQKENRTYFIHESTATAINRLADIRIYREQNTTRIFYLLLQKFLDSFWRLSCYFPFFSLLLISSALLFWHGNILWIHISSLFHRFNYFLFKREKLNYTLFVKYFV